MTSGTICTTLRYITQKVKTYCHRDHMRMFTAASFIITKSGNNQYLSSRLWMNKMWCVHTIEYDLAI